MLVVNALKEVNGNAARQVSQPVAIHLTFLMDTVSHSETCYGQEFVHHCCSTSDVIPTILSFLEFAKLRMQNYEFKSCPIRFNAACTLNKSNMMEKNSG